MVEFGMWSKNVPLPEAGEKYISILLKWNMVASPTRGGGGVVAGDNHPQRRQRTWCSTSTTHLRRKILRQLFLHLFPLAIEWKRHSDMILPAHEHMQVTELVNQPSCSIQMDATGVGESMSTHEEGIRGEWEKWSSMTKRRKTVSLEGRKLGYSHIYSMKSLESCTEKVHRGSVMDVLQNGWGSDRLEGEQWMYHSLWASAWGNHLNEDKPNQANSRARTLCWNDPPIVISTQVASVICKAHFLMLTYQKYMWLLFTRQHMKC